MDKPLSQERLKTKELEEIERQAYMNSISSRPDLRYAIGPEVLKLVAEVKRLQAIETERDRYKEAVDFCISTFQGNEMFIKAEQVKLMIKGVNTE